MKVRLNKRNRALLGLAISKYEKLAKGTKANPEEWMDVAEYQGGVALWQNRRQSTCFSLDSGKTYYNIDEKRKWWRKFLNLGHRGFTIHEAQPA